MPNAPSASSGYPAYKHSGQPWLVEVPAHWDVKRTEHLAHSDKIPVTVAEMEPHMVLHYSIPSIQQTGLPIEESGEEISSGKILVTGGEILISKLNPRKATITSVEADHPFMVASSEFVPLVAHAVDHGFLKWMYQSEDVRRHLSSMVESATKSHQRVNPTDITKLQIPLPPLPEQITIARYLDAKTAQIDELIAAKERLVQLLTEQRTALIHRAVTRGLDPDAPLKDSGVEWLGEVPEGWEVKQIYQIFDITRGRVIPVTDLIEDGKYPVYSSQTKRNGIFGYLDTFDFSGDYITWTTDGANAGTVTRRKGKFTSTNVSGLLKVSLGNRDADIDYLSHVVSIASSHNKRPDTNGAKIMSNEMAIIKIPYPPPATQIQIRLQLEKDLQEFEGSTASLIKQITSLRALRTALISEVVTGKRDVRQHPLARPAACEQSSSNAPL